MNRYDGPDDYSGRSADVTTVWEDRPGRGWDDRPASAWDDRPRQGRAPRRRRSGHSRRWRVLGWIAGVMTVVIVGASLTAYAAYRHLLGNIHHVDVTHLLGKRPPKFNSALNILLIGSDSRAGSNARFGRGIQGARSDTMILLHISPKRNGATLVSFPRDSMVPIIRCGNDGQGHTGQQEQPGTLERLNETFSSGGAPCTWKTVEFLTGIHIDHFVQIDFTGFQAMVNAVGGVNVCLPTAIQDPKSHLNLTAGRHHVSGAQALAFVRERHIGLGSDLQRIQRQQFFMAALLQAATSSHVLSDPARVLSLANAITHSLSTDSGLAVTTMVQIANSMRGLHAGNVSLVSVPTAPYPPDPQAEVQWTPASKSLFNSIKFDATLPKAKKAKAASTPAPTVDPDQVQVQVLNGDGFPGAGEQAGQILGQRGFNIVGTGNANTFNYTNSVVQYASTADLPAANTLRHMISHSELQLVPSLAPGTINLIVGSNFHGLKQKTTPVAPVKNLAKQFGGISGSTNICNNKNAFSGPDQPSDFGPGS
jgi:LCP family protein required for cell wall assembly